MPVLMRVNYAGNYACSMPLKLVLPCENAKDRGLDQPPSPPRFTAFLENERVEVFSLRQKRLRRVLIWGKELQQLVFQKAESARRV